MPTAASGGVLALALALAVALALSGGFVGCSLAGVLFGAVLSLAGHD